MRNIKDLWAQLLTHTLPNVVLFGCVVVAMTKTNGVEFGLMSVAIFTFIDLFLGDHAKYYRKMLIIYEAKVKELEESG